MKLMSLRRPDQCVSCDIDQPVGTQAWWDASSSSVTCTDCRDRSTADPVIETDSPALAEIDRGTPGIGAKKEFERRVAKREQGIEDKWGTGRMGRFVKFMSDDPQSTKAWSKGAAGEEALGGRLNDDLEGLAVVLHDRKMQGTKANIDHIVIGPNGVWIVDAKQYKGEIELRDVGGWFKKDWRLYVNNRDQTKLADGMEKQVAAVRTVLDDMMQVTMPIIPCLCFVGADWALGARPFQIGGVWVGWPKKVVELILEPGPVTPVVIDHLAREISTKLPATH